MILSREPISWKRGMDLLKSETDRRKRREIISSMQQHKAFQKEVQTYREKAQRRRRK